MTAKVDSVTEIIAIYVSDLETDDDLSDVKAVAVAQEQMKKLGKANWTHIDTERLNYNTVMVTFEP